MKILILFTIACIGLKVSHSLPTPTVTDAHEAPSNTTAAVLSDPNSPLRVHVKKYTAFFVAAIKEVTTKVLNKMPDTEPYEKPRRLLTKFLEKNDVFVNELVNCIWNIVDLSLSIRTTLKYFTRPEATDEEQVVANLLIENGYNAVQKDLGVIWWRFIGQEFGSDYNEDYC